MHPAGGASRDNENISITPIQVKITRKSAPVIRPNSSESLTSPKHQIKKYKLDHILMF